VETRGAPLNSHRGAAAGDDSGEYYIYLGMPPRTCFIHIPCCYFDACGTEPRGADSGAKSALCVFDLLCGDFLRCVLHLHRAICNVYGLFNDGVFKK
jgi:hypothetical protein